MRLTTTSLLSLLVLASAGPAMAQGAPPTAPTSEPPPFSIAPQPIIPPPGAERAPPAPFPPVDPAETTRPGQPVRPFPGSVAAPDRDRVPAGQGVAAPAQAGPPPSVPPVAVTSPAAPTAPTPPQAPALDTPASEPAPASVPPASHAAPAAVPPPAPAAAMPATTQPAAATAGSPPSEPPAQAARAAEPAPAAEPAVDPIATAIIAELERARPGPRAAVPREWQSGLVDFYKARNGRPVWFSDQGLTPAGEALVAEMSRADEWGLDPRAFDTAGNPGPGADAAQIAAAEIKLARTVLTYAWHARGGRVDPLQLSKWLDQSPRPLNARAVLTEIAASNDPSVALQKLHPQHPQFELLRQAYLKFRAGQSPRAPVDPREVTIPQGPAVRIGERHPHIALLRQRLAIPAEHPDDDTLYDQRLSAAVREVIGGRYQDRQTGRWVERPAFPPFTNFVRSTLNPRAQQAARPRGPTLNQFLINLERWRWLPPELGATYVWNNLPEYQTRVIRNGEVIFQERIIIGKPTNQTPVFSDEMRFVVFHPDWGVPGTIKVQDLLPALQAGDFSVLERRNMRLAMGNRISHPSEIDWSQTDIRKVAIVQDPGPDNPLGRLKFMFPNKHDVYMHDTPLQNLFETGVRAHSFGCIRVRNPLRFAEVLFGHDRGWGRTEIASLTAPRAQQNHRVDFQRRIPVHNTYFTLLADADGKVSSFADVYGHDQRIQAVLIEGQRPEVVAQSDPALALERRVQELAEAPPRPRPEQGFPGWGGFGWGPPPDYRGGRPMPRNPFDSFFTGLFGN